MHAKKTPIIRSFGKMEFTPLVPLFHFSKTRKSYFATIRKKKTRRKRIIRMRKNYIA